MTQLSINTTQNVEINFTAASVADRILAYLVDLLIKVVYGLIIYFVIFYLMGLNRLYDQMDSWSQGATFLIFYFPVTIYTLVCESMMEGQTFGKKILHIKVVKIDGYQASFGDYLIRWFFRIVDVTFLFGIIAIITVIVTDKNQRLGDMAAGTAVITLKNTVTINSTILEELGSEYVPVYPAVIKLSDNDIRIIKETYNVSRAKHDYVTLTKLREKIEKVTGITKADQTDQQFLATILKDYNYYTQSM
ncbi:MAG TPA: RDD family protein [Flavobacterium sp.]|jgi:uncharacterized RDD family membrane protein YckC